MTRLRIVLMVSVWLLLAPNGIAGGPQSIRPEGGFVPNELTATRIAEAVLIPIYGEDKILAERPFTAKLSGHVWIVTGNLPPEADGGVAEVRIDKRDGKILRVSHGK